MAGRNPYSSLAQSVFAYQPYYAPPVDPQTNYIHSKTNVFDTVDHEGGESWNQHSRMVNRDPRRLGIRTLFSYGGQIRRAFAMIATGAVQSSKFQPRNNHMWSGEFNDALYQAGYPRNTGLTFKVQTVNPLINPPWSMAAAPNRRGRSVFVNRRPVTSGIPAIRANGSYS